MVMKKVIKVITLAIIFSVTIVVAQLAGDTAIDGQPYLGISECANGFCILKHNTYTVAMDANWREVKTNSALCINNGRWVTHVCADPVQCAERCQIAAVPLTGYSSSYGIRCSGQYCSFQVKNRPSQAVTTVGGRIFLMKDKNTYMTFNLLNKEFSVDIEAPQLECGLNGHLKFLEMPADGGKSLYPGNKAGAAFGTGYCDGSCSRESKFVNGEANMLEWETYSSTFTGRGRYGSCCNEFALWEANMESTSMTFRPCNSAGPKRCNGTECNEQCDKDGCDYNPYRVGNKTFFGPNASIDSTAPITVVTQFITHDNTDTGDLVEIRRIYKQGYNVIHNSVTTDASLNGADSITDAYCDAQKTLFNNPNNFKIKGGLKALGESFKRGMVLSMGLWVDHENRNLWLDGNFPADADPNVPGVARGKCPATSGNPQDLIDYYPFSTVRFSAIKYGERGFSLPTQQPTTTPTNPPTVPPTESPTEPPTQPPTVPPTQSPTQPPTQPPTTPPTQPPTETPTPAPINNCGTAFTFDQSRVTSWHSAGVDYSQWKATLTSTLPIHSVSFSLSGSISEYTQLEHVGGGAYTVTGGRLTKDSPIPANIPVIFGYTKVGSESSAITVLSANCTAGAKDDDKVTIPSSSSSLSPSSSSLVSALAIAVVALVSYLL